MVRHLLDVDDLSPGELAEILELARVWPPEPVLAGRGAGLVFEKPSVRTRNSTEMAVVQLGGHPVTMTGGEVGLDTREPSGDVARVLAGYHAVLAARVMSHATLETMAAAVDAAGLAVPVVNLLSDWAHPLQAIADLLTIEDRLGGVKGVTVAYVGDANNVCRSLARACALAGAAEVRVAAPAGHQFGEEEADAVASLGGKLTLVQRPGDAADGADVLYTDVWTSMGQEQEAGDRRDAFAGYTIDAGVLAAARPGSVVLHCLPAHRGEEIAADVIDGPASAVWAQATNRLHAARAALWWLLRAGTA